MKVKYMGRVLFHKGIHLDKDLKPGETGVVLEGQEQSERIQRALGDGTLSAIPEMMNVGGAVVAVPAGEEYRGLAQEIALGPREHMGADANRQGDPNVVTSEQARLPAENADLTDVSSPNYTPVENDQFDEFKRRNGKAKVKYAKAMTDVDSIRRALNTLKTGKTKDALQARLEELVTGQVINLDANPDQ